ncbi:beta 1-4 rhamnosyltransferase Cps2T [Lactococcus lactis]|uniref:DUF1972 domain-containing protein n=1 Tax=Lactococcus lactis subsp. lactis TaxID=1360 RepID=A0AAC9QXW3_LACLL|nr:DUF1972 domain-containing protein [Lactococcus lactis]ARD94866.1 DUF1972 domain-containing protein [Lactococcus lactis subsp. lactis]AZS27662.1 DUF1972 domain-containing protein [Lactococcus lactis subsp. lactis]MRK42676.1 DUF1972 domain-containing protein [Lactococcus lactis subsp. lactis]
MLRHVFIIGSKGIPAKYGGYETFVEYLTKRKITRNIQYHVACKVTNKVNSKGRFDYNGADCFNVYVPQIGPAQAIYYDISALIKSINYAELHNIKEPIFYILACRIGPFMNCVVNKIHSMGGTIYVNPDGHEWMRSKWSYPVRKYWKFSEKLMVKNADLLICDSKNIEKYIRSTYADYKPRTTFIAYGSDVEKSKLGNGDSKIVSWFNHFGVNAKQYYLIVGRFVPENNYETMIREFMKSSTSKDLVIVTDVRKNKFYKNLSLKTNFKHDNRIKFVGTIYDEELLKKIRELAYGYIHGHSVGGTNPSLLEALSSTKINLLYDVSFNREVAQNGARYWSTKNGDLSNLINNSDALNSYDIDKLDELSTNRIVSHYSWDKIIKDYEYVLTVKK